jgi:GNAT superfamily N-acetyltransferase
MGNVRALLAGLEAPHVRDEAFVLGVAPGDLAVRPGVAQVEDDRAVLLHARRPDHGPLRLEHAGSSFICGRALARGRAEPDDHQGERNPLMRRARAPSLHRMRRRRRASLRTEERPCAPVTRVLLDPQSANVGYFTLATAQVDVGDLPGDVAKGLPNRALLVAVLAWLGVDRHHQGHGLGARLLAQALADCHAAARTFPFVAVVLDCIDEAAKAFYARWDFRELPGRPMRLLLTSHQLEALMGRQ